MSLRESRLFNRKHFLILSLICAVVTIPLQNNVNSWALVFFCTMGLIYSVAERTNLKVSRLAVVSAVFFIWLALSSFWDDFGFDIKYVEGFAAFLFLPFLFSVMPKLSARALRVICVAFAVATTAITVICLLKSALEYRTTGDYRVFFYHYLSGQMDLNAIFLSNYCLASITWLLYYWFIHPQRPGKPGRFIIVLWCIYLLFSVLLLSSKLLIFLVIIAITFLLLHIGYKRKQFLVFFIVVLLVIFSAGITASKFHYVHWRFAVTELREYRGEIDNQNGLAIRLLMWQSALELIKERPLAGYGLKGADIELVQKYKEKNFHLGFQEKYHAHNQYLQTTLIAGLVGFAIYAAFLVLIAVRAYRYKSILLWMLLLHYLCISLVESTLEVQQELVFFILFMLLFYYHIDPTVSRHKSIRVGK